MVSELIDAQVTMTVARDETVIQLQLVAQELAA
jgi:hypothetical protein